MNLFDQLYKKTITNLEINLPGHLTFHDSNHTRHVLEKAILIAEKENISDQELYLLKIAALYHDTGYLIGHKNHEKESCRIADLELTELGLKKAEIEQICSMILATQIPQQPKTHLEEILADADLEYLGTEEFEMISNKLFVEIKHFQPNLTLEEWYNIQVDFITKHHYHTDFCKKYREPNKLKNLEKIKIKLQLL